MFRDAPADEAFKGEGHRLVRGIAGGLFAELVKAVAFIVSESRFCESVPGLLFSPRLCRVMNFFFSIPFVQYNPTCAGDLLGASCWIGCEYRRDGFQS